MTNPVFDEVFRRDHHAAGVIGDVLVAVASADPDPEFFADFAALHRKSAPVNGTLRLLVVVRPEAPPPSEPARALMKKYFDQHSADLDSLALCVLGEGFGAAAKRSAMTLIGLVSRFTFTFKVHGTTEAGASWLAGRDSSANVDPDALISAVNRLTPRLAAA